MIPLKVNVPRSTTPLVNLFIISVNVVVFLYQASLDPRAGTAFAYTYGMVPARVELLLAGHGVTLGHAFSPLLTSMFLHGGWLHLIGNMWFLWVFGDNIEDTLGHFNYLLFYLACGIGAGITHIVANLASTVPAVGASGAISGVMGAFIVLFPTSRVLTLVPLLILFFTVHIPAILFLGYWLLIQFLSGLSSMGMQTTGGTAWWAHVGGFILGAVLVLGSRRR